MMVFRFASSASSVDVLSWKISSNSAGEDRSRERFRFSMVICSGNKRILQFVRQAARQFAPRRDALGLNGAVALFQQLLCHAIEGARQFSDFVLRQDLDAGGQIAAGDGARALGQPFHGPGDPLGGPPAQQHADDDAGGGHDEAGPQNGSLQTDLLAQRSSREEHAGEPPGRAASGNARNASALLRSAVHCTVAVASRPVARPRLINAASLCGSLASPARPTTSSGGTHSSARMPGAIPSDFRNSA